MRVGPITPTVPMICPSASYGAVTTLHSSSGAMRTRRRCRAALPERGAQLKNLHEQRLRFEELEQLPQPRHVRREFVRVEQIPLAGYDVVLRRVGQGSLPASSAAVMRSVMSSRAASARRQARRMSSNVSPA